MSIRLVLNELGISLPKTKPPLGAYVPFVQEGGVIYISGQAPLRDDGTLYVGRLGEALDVAQGYEAARACAKMLIAQLDHALSGELDRIRRIIRLGVFVSCTSDFTDQSAVANGASELFEAVFGDAGRHARTAVAAPVLPFGIAVEVDAIVALREDAASGQHGILV